MERTRLADNKRENWDNKRRGVERKRKKNRREKRHEEKIAKKRSFLDGRGIDAVEGKVVK